jgi:hypothetical protein
MTSCALDHLDDALVLRDAHVVAADDAGQAAHAAGDHGVVERAERAAMEAALHVVEILVAEAGDQRLVVVGDVNRAAVGVVGDRHAHDLAGGLGGAVLVELHVHRARDLGLRRGRDELRVEALRERAEGLHDALHVDDHRLDGAGEHGQLLVQEVARRRDAVAHEDLVGGAADAGEVDALRAGGLRLRDKLRVPGGFHEHRRQGGLVPVHDDVDLVVLEDAEVDLRRERRRRAEKDVADVGAQHGAAPAVG